MAKKKTAKKSTPKAGPDKPVVPIDAIRARLMEARDTASCMKDVALEAVLYASQALNLDPYEMVELQGDEDDPKMQLASKIVVLLEWATHVNKDVERAIVDLWEHDTEGKAKAAIADAEWRARTFDKDGNLKPGIIKSSVDDGEE